MNISEFTVFRVMEEESIKVITIDLSMSEYSRMVSIGEEVYIRFYIDGPTEYSTLAFKFKKFHDYFDGKLYDSFDIYISNPEEKGHNYRLGFNIDSKSVYFISDDMYNVNLSMEDYLYFSKVVLDSKLTNPRDMINIVNVMIDMLSDEMDIIDRCKDITILKKLYMENRLKG